MPGSGVRARARNVFFYDFKNPHTQLGGLVLNRGVTNTNFYSMLDIVLVMSSNYFLQNNNGEEVPRDLQPLLAGDYYIIADVIVQVSDEPCLTRTLSLSTGTRVEVFKDEVRERDKRCVVTKRENIGAEYGYWKSWDAAHIFPLAYERYWKDNNFDRSITIPPRRGGTINSVQNGLCLRSHMHDLFDCYDFSINPDDGYRIICFQPDVDDIAGTRLDDRLLNDARRPADELLRWHFRQAVLANMRGAGEPCFETDFPPGSDIMGEIMEGPKAAERMEFELFSRFANQMEIDQ